MVLSPKGALWIVQKSPQITGITQHLKPCRCGLWPEELSNKYFKFNRLQRTWVFFGQAWAEGIASSSLPTPSHNIRLPLETWITLPSGFLSRNYQFLAGVSGQQLIIFESYPLQPAEMAVSLVGLGSCPVPVHAASNIWSGHG